MDIKKYVDEKYEEYLREQFPDPKRRAIARWIQKAANKCMLHEMVYGRKPTDDEVRAYAEGAELPPFGEGA